MSDTWVEKNIEVSEIDHIYILSGERKIFSASGIGILRYLYPTKNEPQLLPHTR